MYNIANIVTKLYSKTRTNQKKKKKKKILVSQSQSRDENVITCVTE